MRKIIFSRFCLTVCAIAFMSAGSLFGQTSDESTVVEGTTMVKSTTTSVYRAKPKDMWELGVNLGYSAISGDVESPFFAGYVIGLHARKAINYVFSYRINAEYSSQRGLDARRTSGAVLSQERTYQQTDNKGTLAGYRGSFIHRNYRNNTLLGSVDILANVGNILFHKDNNKWNLNAGIGLGLMSPSVKVDLLNGSSLYDFSGVSSGLDLKTVAGRKDARKRLKDLLDGDRETDGGKENTIAAFGDTKSILPMFRTTVSVARKLNRRVNLGVELAANFVDSDLLDGYEYRTTVDQTNNNDIQYQIKAQLGVNLGDFNNRTEPLYWLNPLGGAFNDLAELKARPVLDLTDTDGDGIIDMLDQEVTDADCPVDTRGIALDSDGDGISDCNDAEPYSPPGYDIDSKGVAQMPPAPDYVTADDVNQIVNDKLANIRTDWFLPMVHFDLDKYAIKPEFYGQLHHVATVMKMHPGLKIKASGFTDNRNPNDYNNVLAYNRAVAAVDYIVANYGVARERFVISYGGENAPLIGGLPDNHNIDKNTEKQHYMNRRVEFSIAKAGETSMGRPAGPDAGKKTMGSSRKGSKYSGNKNSGYRP